jgi:hypothetical protein
MLHKMSVQRNKLSSRPFLPPSPYSPFFLFVVLEISIKIQMCSTKGEIFHTPPLSLCSLGGWIADYRVDYEIRVNSGMGPSFSLNKVSGSLFLSFTGGFRGVGLTFILSLVLRWVLNRWFDPFPDQSGNHIPPHFRTGFFGGPQLIVHSPLRFGGGGERGQVNWDGIHPPTLSFRSVYLPFFWRSA